MDLLIQQVVTGLSSGGAYASLALALVMIHRATRVVNLAQGEMAMFSTYIAWSLVQAGVPFWAAFALTLAISLAGGMTIERVVMRRFADSSLLTVVIVMVGLLVIFNSAAGFIWTYQIRTFPSPFPDRPIDLGGLFFRYHDLGAFLVTLAVLAILYAFFQFTKLGLGLRAAADNPISARLSGIPVGLMVGLGWGLAGAIGAVAGMMIAPVVFLDPHMMSGLLIYAFAAALLGGIDSPIGAVVGGFAVGILENLFSTFVPVVGGELKLVFALAIIVAVLLIKPSGLFGKHVAARV
jgi:branched-chain amino acid transport system permease protein